MASVILSGSDDGSTLPTSSAGPVATQPGPSTQGPTADLTPPKLHTESTDTSTTPPPAPPPATTPPPKPSFTPDARTVATQAANAPSAIGGVTPWTNATDPSTLSELQQFSSVLANYPNDPQAAIDAFNAHYPNNTLKPQYYAGKNVIGVTGQQLPYLTAPGTTPGQTTWNFGGVPGGDSGNGGSGGAGTNTTGQIFDDPATAAYEQLIDALTKQLSTPYAAPDYQSSLDQLKAYQQQLQGPAYTPQQEDLIQTQSTDPIASARDAARQQIIQHFAALGQSPTSGTVQAALLQSDNSFATQRTQAQSAFAANAVNFQRQNAATAASLGPQIAGLETSNNANNESRALQAANLAGIIPALAQSRIAAANGVLQPINPASLIPSLLSANQTGYQNTSDFVNGILKLLEGLAQ